MKVLMTLALVLVLSGCAAGQGNAGRTSAEEGTTAHLAKEETTVQERAGDLKRPPDSTLSYDGREVKGSLGSYCWMYGNRSLCADTTFITPPRKRTLTVPSGSEMVFRYGGRGHRKRWDTSMRRHSARRVSPPQVQTQTSPAH